MRRTLTTLATIGALTLAACSSGEDEAGATDLPAYEVTVAAEGQITVLTDATDPNQLRAIFDEVRSDHRDDGDDWYVAINCASVASTETFDPRLANGRFANTNLGQARTGLASTDDVEFEPTGRGGCEPPTAADEEAMAEAMANAGIPPEPDQATADAYIAALDAIHPGIDRDDPQSAIGRGRNQCRTVRDAPDDRTRQIETTNQRFTSPDAPDGWGPEIAEQILDVVTLFLCPTP